MKAIVILHNRVFGFGFFTRFYEIEGSADLKYPFFDGKIRNFEYRVVLGHINRRVIKRGSEFIGVDLSVLNLIAKKDRSSVRQIELSIANDNIGEIFQMMGNGSADLFMIAGLSVNLNPFIRQINTYDENAFCALVPLPPRLTFLHFLLTPFDNLSWMLLIAVIVGCACIWKLLTRSLKRAFVFLFFAIGGFFGQFVDLKVNRRVLVMLVQLFTLMTFILGNGYQSLIISAMTVSRNGIRFKTFEELFQSDLNFITDGTFRNFFIKSGDVLQFRMREINESFNFSKIIGNNIAVVAPCQQLEQLYYFAASIDLASHFYILPEHVMKFYEKLDLAFGSALYEYLQLQHDRVFEAGLRPHLLRLLTTSMLAQQNREIAYIENEKYLLSLDDIGGIFFLLLAGYGISLMTLVFEVVLNNFEAFKIFFRREVRKFMQCVKRRFRPLINIVC